MASTPKIKRKPRLAIELLDRSRPFGEVYGEHVHQVKYTQNARKLQAWPYDAHGNLVEASLNEKQAEMLAAMRAAAEKAAAEAPAEEVEAIEDAAEADDVVNDDDGELEPDATRVKDDDGVNLELWLRGELRLTQPVIQKVLKARYGVNKPSLVQQALYLVEEQKLIPRDQVSIKILPKQQV